MILPPELLELLACPVCHGRLVALPDDNGFQCASCQRVYPVRDNLPILLVEEATNAPK